MLSTRNGYIVFKKCIDICSNYLMTVFFFLICCVMTYECGITVCSFGF